MGFPTQVQPPTTITSPTTFTGLITGTAAGSASEQLTNGLVANAGATPIYLGYAGFCGLGDANNGALVKFDGAGHLGFYNTTPVAQAAAITAPAATASTNVTPFGYTTAAQADAIVTAVRALQAAVKNLGLTA